LKNVAKQAQQYSSSDFKVEIQKIKANNITDVAFHAMQAADGKETIYNKVQLIIY